MVHRPKLERLIEILRDNLADLRRLAERLADWASMRNVLAHFYPIVDFRMVVDTLRQDLGDLDEYLATVHRLLDEDTDAST